MVRSEVEGGGNDSASSCAGGMPDLAQPAIELGDFPTYS